METIAIVTNPTVSAGKWIGNSSVSVSATDYKNQRRIPPPPRHPNHPRRPVKLPTLDRVVHHVSGYHSPLGTRGDIDAAMAGRRVGVSLMVSSKAGRHPLWAGKKSYGRRHGPRVQSPRQW
jgi:hypothetical protein